jgi:single-stranded-DNA-specific exonuclease
VASARSVRGIDFGAAVTAARQRGLLVAGGGHAMAAGITVKLERLEETRQFLEEHLARQGAAAGAAPVLHLDGALAPAAATLDFVEILDRLQPFGSGNAEPRFAFSDMAVRHADVVGQDHVRCRLGAPGGGTLQGIAFRAAEGALGQGLLRHGGAPVHMAGRLRANTWMGKTSVQLLIDDAAPGN